MWGLELRLTDRERALHERVEPHGVAVHVRDQAHHLVRVGQVRRVGRELAALDGERDLEQRIRGRVVAGVVAVRREVDERGGRAEVGRAEGLRADGEGALVESAGRLGLVLVVPEERGHAERLRQLLGVGIGEAVERAERRRERRVGLGVAPELHVHAPDHAEERGLEPRLAGQLRPHARRAAPQHVHHEDRVAPGLARVRVAEDVAEEGRDLGGLGRLGLGAVPLGREADGIEGRQRDDGDHGGGRPEHAGPVAADEPAEAVAARRRAGPRWGGRRGGGGRRRASSAAEP